MGGGLKKYLASLCKCYLVYFGVADEDRTRNPQSGNLMLHHLSYSDVKKRSPPG